MAQIIKNFDPKKDILLINPREVCSLKNIGEQLSSIWGMALCKLPVLITEMEVSHIKSVTIDEFIKKIKTVRDLDKVK